MKKAEYMALVDRELANIKEVIKAKNHDYTSDNDSAFANFESTADIAPPMAGVLIRIGDKIQRLKTYVAKGSLQVKGESAQDAARDLIGYSLILLGMLAESEVKPKTRLSHVDEAVERLALEIEDRL